MKELTLFAFKNESLFNISYVGSNLLNDKEFIRELIKITNDKYYSLKLGDKISCDIDFVIEKWKRTIEDSDDNIERLIKLDNELIKAFEEKQ